MSIVSRFSRKAGATVLLGACLAVAPTQSGCAVGADDLHRWEGTEHGPDKLYAVIVHNKYSDTLRTEAILGLVRMPARSGQRIGLRMLTEKHKTAAGDERDAALLAVDEPKRSALIELLLPELLKQLQTPPSPRDADGRVAADPTVPYKDAVFAMVFHDPPIITNAETKKKLTDGLIKWAQIGFEDRVENSTQQFGFEQMMRALGKESVKLLPQTITDKAYRIDRTVNLINEIGDDETKKRASDALVVLAKKLDAPEWWAEQTKIVEEHNAKTLEAGKQKPGADKVKGQVAVMQSRRFNEDVYPAMKKLGGKPVIDYLFGIADDVKRPEERRKLALAALEGKPDKKNPQDLERLFAIVKNDDSSDALRDVAFNRIGELPKEQTLPKLYQLMEPKKWKVRWVAASLILRQIKTTELAEFFSKLPTSAKTKMGMTEGLSYGDLIQKMEPSGTEPKPRDIVLAQLNSKSFGARFAALGYFRDGKKADIGLLKQFEDDKDAVPKCDAEEECLWKCAVPKAGAEPELKDVATIGELVRQCIIPTMIK
jgi:hypothetical protein